jgi:hypothetical protein
MQLLPWPFEIQSFANGHPFAIKYSEMRNSFAEAVFVDIKIRFALLVRLFTCALFSAPRVWTKRYNKGLDEEDRTRGREREAGRGGCARGTGRGAGDMHDNLQPMFIAVVHLHNISLVIGGR